MKSSTENTISEHQAGLYAFKKNWNPVYLGWENHNQGAESESSKLHIRKVQNLPTITETGAKDESGNFIEDKTVEWVNEDGITETILMKDLLAKNILKCHFVEEDDHQVEAEYWDTFDGTKKTYIYSDMTVAPRSVLTLGRQTKKVDPETGEVSNMIGFWPYNGTTVKAHRCYIEASALTLSEDNEAKGVTFAFEDPGKPTGVRLEKVDSSVEKKSSSEWYTLQGTRLDRRPTQQGIYINNGRKVFVK